MIAPKPMDAEAPLGTAVRLALGVVLAVALIGEAVVLYTVQARETRFLFGMLIVAVVVGATAVLASRSAHRDGSARSRFYHRRFIRLRANVDEFIEMVRRLHRVAVDAERGVRDRVAARHELDLIEQRLTLLVQEIRAAAGSDEASRKPRTVPVRPSPAAVRRLP